MTSQSRINPQPWAGGERCKRNDNTIHTRTMGFSFVISHITQSGPISQRHINAITIRGRKVMKWNLCFSGLPPRSQQQQQPLLGIVKEQDAVYDGNLEINLLMSFKSEYHAPSPTAAGITELVKSPARIDKERRGGGEKTQLQADYNATDFNWWVGSGGNFYCCLGREDGCFSVSCGEIIACHVT